ncbi:MAG: glycoside hydrolase family 2 protein, partial [Candidatus Acidiferrales bacterium]
IHLRVHLKNDGIAAALETKITILNVADASRILPAYLSDNYVSLLPGESREIDVEYPAAAHGAAQVAIRGWNLASRTISVTAAK